MPTPVEALEAALYDSDQPNTRKTFGNVEYALIPVAVVEAVLTDDVRPDEVDLDETDYGDENVNEVEGARQADAGFPDDEADGEVTDDPTGGEEE